MPEKSQQFIESLKKTLLNYTEAEPGRILLCCVSGGADSTALFHALHRLSPVMGFYLEAIHVNHGIRGEEANLDEDFVMKMCREANAPYHIRRLAFRKGEKATEDAMRKKRYEAIRECAKETGASAAILGHQRDDLAETFLMRLLKGGGLKGLSGFREYSLFRDLPLIRPFKNISRKDILQFLKQNRISWREDRTNRDPAYLRNKLRLELIPLLEREFNPAIKRTLAHCADHFSGVYDYLKSEIESFIRKKVKKASAAHLSGEWMYLKDLVSLPDLMMTEIFRLRIMNIFKADSPPGAREIEALDKLVRGEKSGTLLRLSGGLIAYRDYERIILSRMPLPRHASREKIIEEMTPLLLTIQNEKLCQPFFPDADKRLRISSSDIPQKGKSKILSCGNLEFTLRISGRRLKETDSRWTVPLDKINFPIEIRTRKPKDCVKIGGLSKPLKKWLEETRIPTPFRDHIAILCDAKGNILQAGTLAPCATENLLPPFLIIKWKPNTL